MKPEMGTFQSPAEATPAPALTGRCVLVVDDNVDAAESLAMILNIGGHQAHCAFDPEGALQAVASLKPHIVLLDIGLPRMDGYEVARRIRAGERAVKLIALSGYGRSEDTQRAAAAGFDAYLVKPVDFDELERVLGSMA
jgi:CheY-like chemotaxis protein